MSSRVGSNADLSPGSEEFWEGSHADRLSRFAALRASPHPRFHAEASGGPGFWSMVSYADVCAVSADPVTFSSASGFTIDDVPPDVSAFAASMVSSDDPEHARLRGRVQGAFTATAVGRLRKCIGEHARATVDAIPAGDVDFARSVSTVYPLRVLCDMVGIPPEDLGLIRGWVDRIVGASADGFTTGPVWEGVSALHEAYDYALRLASRRAADPGLDVVGRLVRSSMSGQPLSPNEFGSFFILLITAGFDTTRHAVSWATYLLSVHPNRRLWLRERFDDRVGAVVDEVIRFSSPVPYMRRTATRDVSMAGSDIAAGDKVVMWYISANHDERVHDEPAVFDPTRTRPQPHLGFGARSVHRCLGANLARVEIECLLRELDRARPELRVVAPPVLTNSAFVNGIASLPTRRS